MERKFCVYKHTSPSGKVYIGITCKVPEKRWGTNGYYYRKQTVFYNAIKKYGWENFKHEILFRNLTHDEAVKKEIELISFYKSNCSKYYNPMYGYNQTDGGEGQSGYVFSDKRKREMSKRMSGENNPFYGKCHSQETINRLSQNRKGNGLGKDNPNYGNYWSDEQKEKASKMMIGNVISVDTKEKLSKSLKGKNNPMFKKQQSVESVQKNKNNQPNTKKVRCIELNIVFDCISECARYFNVSPGCISSACRRNHLCKNYHFEIISTNKGVNREIYMCDMNENIIKKYNSPKEASDDLNIRINNIWNALRGDQKTAHGYIWKYAS